MIFDKYYKVKTNNRKFESARNIKATIINTNVDSRVIFNGVVTSQILKIFFFLIAVRIAFVRGKFLCCMITRENYR